jgi:NTP pyrophosphatase (non-canonical NTP hydrolase)
MIHKEQEILQWALDRNLIGPEGKATPEGQARKTLEEAREIYSAIVGGDREETLDGIGDTFVTLVIQAHLQNTTMAECIDKAYDVIKNRTGRMSNGVFVKDA